MTDGIAVTVELFAIADAVTVMSDGRVNLLGGVPEFWSVPAADPRGRLSLALTLSTSGMDVAIPIQLALHLMSEHDGEILRSELTMPPGARNPDLFVSGARAVRSMAIVLELEFQSVGPHSLELIDPGTDQVISAAGFSVRFT